MELSPERPIPLYYQLKTLLLEEILGGAYGRDGRLPTEQELCARFGISRTPVARAVSELAADGVVLRHRRRGTFVNPHWLTRSPGSPELRVLVPETGPWEQHLRAVAGPGTRLSLAAVDLNELHSVFMRAVAEGHAPDLAVLDSVWIAEFAASGFLRPLREVDASWVENDYERDFLQPFVGAHQAGGSAVAVQAEVDMGGVWYNHADLAAAGAEPPATWAELRAAGHKLLASGGHVRDQRPVPRQGSRHPLVIPAGPAADELATYCLVMLLASNGAQVLGPDAVTLDSPASVETMELLRSLADDGVIPEEAVSYERDRPIQLLAEDAATMCFGGIYQAPRLAQAAGIAVGEVTRRFGFLPVPAGPRGRRSVLVGGMAFCIPRQAHQPALAMTLLKDATATGALVDLCARTGHLPPRRSAVEVLARRSTFHAQTAGLLDGAVIRPVTPVYALVSAQLRAMAEAVLTHRLRPRAAVRRTAEMLSAITGLPAAGARAARR